MECDLGPWITTLMNTTEERHIIRHPCGDCLQSSIEQWAKQEANEGRDTCAMNAWFLDTTLSDHTVAHSLNPSAGRQEKEEGADFPLLSWGTWYYFTHHSGGFALTKGPEVVSPIRGLVRKRQPVWELRDPEWGKSEAPCRPWLISHEWRSG